MSALDVSIRDAKPGDYGAFVELVPLLAVGDPTPPRERFEAEYAPTTLIAESGGEVAGYSFYQVTGETAYVRHVVVAERAQGRRVGEALLRAVAARAQAEGATDWCLNVKPDNLPALRLYTKVGMKEAFRSKVLQVPWAMIDARPGPLATKVRPEDDARVETAAEFLRGTFAQARARGGRVLGMVELRAAAVFDPAFPGSSPFSAATTDDAIALLRYFRGHARPEHAGTAVMIENQPATADGLLAAGARPRLELLRMKGTLPR